MSVAPHSLDVGRRVIQCVTCDRTAKWSGDETARLAGWHSKWIERGIGVWIRRWSCASCWVPAQAVRSPARHQLPAYIETLMSTGQDQLAREQLELVRHDADRFAAYLDGITRLVAVRWAGKRGKAAALRKRWTAYVNQARRSLPRVSPRELVDRLFAGAPENT